jgi:hypothetical protein
MLFHASSDLISVLSPLTWLLKPLNAEKAESADNGGSNKTKMTAYYQTQSH